MIGEYVSRLKHDADKAKEGRRRTGVVMFFSFVAIGAASKNMMAIISMYVAYEIGELTVFSIGALAGLVKEAFRRWRLYLVLGQWKYLEVQERYREYLAEFQERQEEAAEVEYERRREQVTMIISLLRDGKHDPGLRRACEFSLKDHEEYVYGKPACPRWLTYMFERRRHA